MRLSFCQVSWLVLLIVFSLFSKTTVVSAVESSTGSILVTGSVPPQSNSITTQMSVSPSAGEIYQDQILTYTFSYSSSNVTSVPVIFQVEWGKGRVEGASENNVDAVKYVLGSATSAYGVAPAIVDTQNKTITWEVASLPAGVGMQFVTFQLQTTANYTGPLKVSVPVIGKVLLPAGVSDKQLSTNFKYQPVSLNAAEVISTSTPTPSATSTLTTSPSATATTILSPSANKKVTSVLIRSLGMGSAKISIQADLGTNLELRYGDSPINLFATIKSDSSTKNHEIYITNLNPDSQYYFTVSPAGRSATSDIFTFKTASAGTVGVTRKATSMTVSQNRSVIYSGDTTEKEDQPGSPMVVMQSSVIDLVLNTPNSKEIVNFEVEIRPQLVLGESTEKNKTDDFQSLTTKVTQISDGVYVGKVRTPVTAGQYSIVSRIEDIYGNLSEAEIGSIIVTSPMTIVNKKNGRPIEYAQVDLWIYSQQTRLFEVVSNVTTSISNPTYSNKDGIVDLNLLPAKYMAKVTASGYYPQDVEFEVGTDDVQNFPRIELEPTKTPFGAIFGNTIRIITTEWLELLERYYEISKSQNLYNLFIFFDLILIVVCSWKVWSKRKTQKLLLQFHRFFVFGIEEVVIFSMNLYLLNGVVLSLFFIDTIGLLQGLLAIGLTLALGMIWTILLWQKRIQI